jgi:hypothetical protein
VVSAGGKFTAHDGAAETQDGAGERPPTQAELDYVDARVTETRNAIKAIKAKIKGMEHTLAEAEQAHQDAKSERARVRGAE